MRKRTLGRAEGGEAPKESFVVSYWEKKKKKR